MAPNRILDMTRGAHLASKYGAVLPITTRRTPFVSHAEATQDPRGIAALWQRYPAAGVGVLTRTRNLLVVDVEHASKREGCPDGFATLERMAAKLGPLPATRAHSTKSRGMHFVFAVPHGIGLRPSQGNLRGGIACPGVDIITGNGMMRWPPTPGYVLASSCVEPAVLPEAWVDAMLDPPAPPRATQHMGTTEHLHRYVAKALEREAADVATLGGGRNCGLAAAAFKLGTLIPHVSLEQIETVLLASCEANGSLVDHGRLSCLSTIRRCATRGSKEPRKLEL
jgi:hypothetical protein